MYNSLLPKCLKFTRTLNAFNIDFKSHSKTSVRKSFTKQGATHAYTHSQNSFNTSFLSNATTVNASWECIDFMLCASEIN